MTWKSEYYKLLSEKVYNDSGLGKWFNRESAGGGPGWDRYDSTGKRVGKCGDSKEGAPYAACLSRQKAQKLGKSGISKFVKRKRASQSKAGRGKKGQGKKGKAPIFVETGASKVEEQYMADTYIVEGFGGTKMQFPLVDVSQLEPYDIFIDKTGNIFEVNDVEEDGGRILLNYTVQSGMNEGIDSLVSVKINESFGLYGEAPSNMINEWGELEEEGHTGNKKVKLNKIMRGDVKKYKVYVKNDKGNVVKVNFGDPNMEIKRDDPDRRRNFRARHNCDTPGPRWKARYWACKTWSAKPVSAMLKEGEELSEEKKNKPKNPKQWSSCISQAKKKFDVYPSAYANAWAAKCYKKKKGKWKKVAEQYANEILKKSYINESKSIENIENTIDLNKNGIYQAIAYLKQYFTK
jgi:hypothetical protein